MRLIATRKGPVIIATDSIERASYIQVSRDQNVIEEPMYLAAPSLSRPCFYKIGMRKFVVKKCLGVGPKLSHKALRGHGAMCEYLFVVVYPSLKLRDTAALWRINPLVDAKFEALTHRTVIIVGSGTTVKRSTLVP